MFDRDRDSENQPSHTVDAERLRRLQQQSSLGPERLVVRDESLHRLLAIAGSGGSY